MNGINAEKLRGLIEGSLGIKMANRRSYGHIERKVRSSVEDLFEQRKEENIMKHVQACIELGCEQIDWSHNGLSGHATAGEVSMDGAGSQRIYGHKGQGNESASVYQSAAGGVPLLVEISRVSV
jgi:hypothetical protein